MVKQDPCEWECAKQFEQYPYFLTTAFRSVVFMLRKRLQVLSGCGLLQSLQMNLVVLLVSFFTWRLLKDIVLQNNRESKLMVGICIKVERMYKALI